MSFSNFINEEVDISTPKPNKIKLTINLGEYKELLSESVLHRDKKDLIKRLMNKKGEFPFFCENNQKFYMCDLFGKKKKTREIKNREDKLACGILLNSMIVKEHKNNNQDSVNKLKEMNLNWEAPKHVYKTM